MSTLITSYISTLVTATIDIAHPKYSVFDCLPREEFELTANSLGAHIIVTESSPGMGHGELISTTIILFTMYSYVELIASLL